MKTLVIILLLTSLSSSAWAQSYKLTWAVTDLNVGGVNFPLLELDVMQTGRYMAAHGAVLTQSRQLSPASGTCSPIPGGYFCNLQIDRSSFFLSLDNQLNGKITGRDSAGNALPEATATLLLKQ